jgi:hypothetical protein
LIAEVHHIVHERTDVTRIIRHGSPGGGGGLAGNHDFNARCVTCRNNALHPGEVGNGLEASVRVWSQKGINDMGDLAILCGAWARVVIISRISDDFKLGFRILNAHYSGQTEHTSYCFVNVHGTYLVLYYRYR